MQISVIPADKTIVIDGVALVFDFAVFSPKIHAIQWNGSSGTIEYKTGAATWFDNSAMIDGFVEEYNTEAARVAAAAEAAPEAEKTAAAAT